MTDAPASSGWIEWSGGPNPVPGQRVDVRDKSGVVAEDEPSDFWASPGGGGDYWRHEGPEREHIVAYRVVTPSDTPASAAKGDAAAIKAVIDCLDFTIDRACSNEDGHDELPPKLSAALCALTNAYNARPHPSQQAGTDGEIARIIKSELVFCLTSEPDASVEIENAEAVAGAILAALNEATG